jgi:triosephosphate isomerase (TIM)
MRKKFIAGNWKMYTSHKSAIELAKAVSAGVSGSTPAMVAVCPPFPWLTAVKDALSGSNVLLGGQDCSPFNEGAYTGSVSPVMLKDSGCDYVIIGHSERRHGLNESDELLNTKLKAGLAAGLKVIYCIGELLAEREANKTEGVLHLQLTFGLAGLTEEQLANVVLAYEPVWAIGTGKVATPEQAQETHAFIRKRVGELSSEACAEKMIIQYGGSVKPDNAKTLLSLPDVDGALVGGASLKADQFLAIVNAAG